MFKWLAGLFGAEKAPEKPKSKYDGYAVQHLKEVGLYLAFYNGYYLRTSYPSGLVEQVFGKDWIEFAQQFRTEEAAWRFIDRHIDQQGRETTSFITR